MEKRNLKQKILAVIMLSVCSFLLSTSIVSAGTIRKPPNNLGLVLYWPMDEGIGGQVGDMSGNGNHGTLSGNPFLPSWVSGKLGKAVLFGASPNGMASLSNVSTTNTHTVSFWIYLTGNCSSWGAIFSQDQTNGLYCNNSGGNKITYYYLGADHFNNTALALNRWYHVAVVNNAGSATFYLNGASDGTTPVAPGYFANSVGSDSINEYLSARLDDLRVYNRALTASEVLALYQSGSAKIGLTDLNPGTLKNGLTGHWTFDGKDMTSNVADVSGNGRHGVLTNFTSTTTAPGKVGQALTFDGSNDYVNTNVPLNNFVTASVGTISAWLKPSATVSPSCQTSSIYNCDLAVSGNTVFGGFGIGRGNNTTVGADKIWAINMTGLATHQIAGADYTPGEWVHITWMHSGGTLSIYKNGEFVESTSSGNSSDLSQSLWIGRGWTGSAANPWAGDIDDVRTWNRALTASEIKQVYNIGAGQKVSTSKTPIGTLTDGLAGYWTFDGPDVNWGNYTVTDKSGNGITGTISSGSLIFSTTTSPVPGKSGQALNFIASGAHRIELGTSSTIQPGTGSFSASVWYKGLNGQAGETFVAGGTGCCNYWIVNRANAIFNFFGGGNVTKSYTLPADNDWHHLVAVLNRTPSPDTLEVFIDGVSQGSATNTLDGENLTVAQGTVIGRPTWITGHYRNGPIDEVRIYQRVLSASEVKQLYNLGK